MTTKKLKRALSVDALERKKYRLMTFDGKFAATFGETIEYGGSWIIYGDAGNGKTDGSLQFAKYLTRFGRVIYNSLEERARYTLHKAVVRQKFSAVERRKMIILSEPIAELRTRLRKPKSANFIFIDSLQFSMITKQEYLQLIDEFPHKTFIWISHVEGNLPDGAVARLVYYNAEQKIHVKGFKMFNKSRTGGFEEYIINQERADSYWNIIN